MPSTNWVVTGGKARCDKLAGGPSGRLQLLELEAQRAVGVEGDGGIAVVDVSAAGARLISFQKGGRFLLAKEEFEGRRCDSLPQGDGAHCLQAFRQGCTFLNTHVCRS